MDTIMTQLKILIDITDKKIALLTELFNISENQEQLFLQHFTDEPVFGQMVDEKQKRIDTLAEADDTFMDIYENVRTVIIEAQPQYRELIRLLQSKVFASSDLEIKIKIQEQKNQTAGFSLGRAMSTKSVAIKKPGHSVMDLYTKSKNMRGNKR